MIDYSKKITTQRELYPMNDLDISIESDRGRILSAPALRRLQKKTQVFPLELNAAVRSRLTHSMEVAQTARYIAKTILQRLDGAYGLKNLDNAFVSTAEMTSLLHDIGNPPFGHFAEVAINDWMQKHAKTLLQTAMCTTNNNQDLEQMLLEDLCQFDGNAQAIRVVTKLQRLNLSYTQIASIIKYTKAAYEKKPQKDGPDNYLKKKPGFYYSEEALVKNIQESLQIKQGRRFPITYIMEAADDICYLNADIEDAVDKGILSFEDVYSYIKKECKEQQEDYLLNLIEEFYQKAKKNEDEPYQFNLFLTLTRAKLTHALVNHVCDIYIQNHEEVFEGSFNSALLEYDQDSKYTKAVKVLQNISVQHIYSHKSIETLELKGYKILTSLLDTYSALLKLSSQEFEALCEGKRIDCYVSQRLIRRLSSKHIVAYKNDIALLNKTQENSFSLKEWYYRARLILDYISGMTDDFAYDEYKMLNALQ